MRYFIFLLFIFGIFLYLDRPRCFDDWTEVDYLAKKEGYSPREGPKINSEGKEYWLLFHSDGRDVTLIRKRGKICTTHHFDTN